MSAMDKIRKKTYQNKTEIEKCLQEVWEINGLEYLANSAAEELQKLTAENLKLREESVFLNDYEKVTLYVCDECKTISNTAGICIICNESLQEKDYYAKEE